MGVSECFVLKNWRDCNTALVFQEATYYHTLMLTLDSENLHHAYLIEGSENKVREIFALLESWGFVAQANPDLFYKTYETFGIDEARELKQIQSEKSLGGKRFFVITTQNMTTEAMQALLKVFEEPTPGNHFFIVLPDADAVLPTLLSRFFVIRGTKEASILEAEKFLSLSPKGRLDFIKKFAKDHGREDATKLVAGLEAVMKKNNRPTEEFSGLFAARRDLSSRGASVKMILEHLALNLD
jgi:DNA polymerase III delta prime subunit